VGTGFIEPDAETELVIVTFNPVSRAAEGDVVLSSEADAALADISIWICGAVVVRDVRCEAYDLTGCGASDFRSAVRAVVAKAAAGSGVIL
jgi:hypothetical protein